MAKIAVITGSGKKRVGYHVACEAARRGYFIAVHYNTSASEAKETVAELKRLGSPDARAYQADFSDHISVEAFATEVLSHFKQIDLLVNTASVWPKLSLLETQYKDLKNSFDINLASGLILSKLLGLQMTKQEQGGLIVNVGDWSIRRPYLDYSAYYAGKGAIPTMTAVFAKELAAINPNVRVNCIEPGPVMVPDEISEAEKAAICRATLVQKLGLPDNVVKAVFSLVENDFVTGACIPVDGGRSIAG